LGLLELLKSLAGIEHWDFSDRRGTLRIPCQIQGRLRKGDADVNVEIVDIGMRGLQVLVHGKVRKGSVVEILSHDQNVESSVKCRIEWKKEQGDGFLTGVSFQDTEDALGDSWLLKELKEIGNEAIRTEQRRSGVRVICMAEAKLKIGDTRKETLLVDLGLGGALIELESHPLSPGELVRFEFGPIDDLSRVVINSEVAVAYQRETPRYGLRFDTFFVGGVTDLERYLTYFYALRTSQAS
jgi:PilZ domain